MGAAADCCTCPQLQSDSLESAHLSPHKSQLCKDINSLQGPTWLKFTQLITSIIILCLSPVSESAQSQKGIPLFLQLLRKYVLKQFRKRFLLCEVTKGAATSPLPLPGEWQLPQPGVSILLFSLTNICKGKTHLGVLQDATNRRLTMLTIYTYIYI